MAHNAGKLSKPIVRVKKQPKTLAEIRDAMLRACKIMDTLGLVQGFGHVSSRLPGTTNLLVTPPKPLGQVTEDDLVVIDAQGNKVSGSANPFLERYLHLGIYEMRPDVGAICRFHSDMTSVFGVLNRSIRPVHALGYLLGTEVRVLSCPDLGSTPEMADKIREFNLDSYGILFRGNGAATLGANIIDACVRAFLLEESARLLYQASVLGQPVYLSASEMDRRNEDYSNSPEYDVYWRFWQYFESRNSGRRQPGT